MTRARFIGVVLPQATCAFFAEATASFSSPMVESGNSADCSPVAGLNTGTRRVEAET
ncbi:hypothetical protein D3C87_2042260 [compost metagenome]